MINKKGKTVSTKPWQTAEWKKLREALIKDYCEQCGRKEGPFVLHHLKRLSPLMLTRRKVEDEIFDEYCRQNNVIADKHGQLHTIIQKEGLKCPICSITISEYHRRKDGMFVCTNGHVVEHPIEGLINKKVTVAKTRFKRCVKHELNENIRQETIRQQQQQYEDYMAGDNTKTFCKKCAYLWDKQGKKLCSKCKQHYHSFKYETCFECSGKKKD